MAGTRSLSTLLSLTGIASLVLAGCGGKSDLEVDPLQIPADTGDSGSGATVSYGGAKGGAASTTTIRPSGGSSLGGKVAFTGGRTAAAGTDVAGGQVGNGGRVASGGFGGNGLGGRGQGGRGGVGGYGGRIGNGGSGGYTTTGGQPIAPGCVDEISYTGAPLLLSRALNGYSDGYQPSCGRGTGTSDFKYAWYASTADTYIIDTLGSVTDTVLAVYSGLCGATELTCNDDDAYGTSRQSRTVLEVTEPQFLTIAVDSYAAATGNVQLKINAAASLVNTQLPQLVPLSVAGSTVGQLDHSTSTCNGKTSSRDYVYLYRAPTNGAYHFVVESSTFDPVLSLRENSVAGKEISCNDDFTGSNASVTQALYAGQTIALVVDGFEGSAGDFRFYITLDTSDSGSCCTASTTRLGCTNSAISSCVCGSQPSCCRNAWDPYCVTSVSTLGCGSCLL